MSLIADRLSGVVCLGMGAWFHVSDQYVHVIGDQIINAGHHARTGSGSWSLLNALMFSRPKCWMVVFLALGVLFLAKSVVAEYRQRTVGASNKSDAGDGK